jgi:hypothetical protein
MSQKIQTYLHEEMQAWLIEFIQRRKAYLRSRRIKASGDLINSLEGEVTRQAIGDAVELVLAFEEHGRYIDMRRLNVPAGGPDYIKALEEWIQEKGLLQKFTDRYMRRRGLRRVPPRILNQLAWGIAIKRKKRKRFRRKAWYNKSRTAAVEDLFNRVVANLPDLATDEIKDSMKQ